MVPSTGTTTGTTEVITKGSTARTAEVRGITISYYEAARVPADGSLRQNNLADNQAAVALWNLLMSRPNLGATTVSKLLAAKRPHLVPIYDSYVADALLPKTQRRRW